MTGIHLSTKWPGLGFLLLPVVLQLLITSVTPVRAQTLKTIYNFTGGTDGSVPRGTLIKDAKGNLFGIAATGGEDSNCTYNNTSGCGTVFELAHSGGRWSFNVLYSFRGYPDDGGNPGLEALAFDKAGNLYGATVVGGDLSCPLGTPGCGTVFKLAPSETGWTESVLYNFAGPDDSLPIEGVVLDGNGNIYGTNNGYDGDGGGVFELTPTGTETVLHSFHGGADGLYPRALLLDKEGSLYGTTIYGGGSGCGGPGCGIIFKLAPDLTETILYSFTGGQDGYDPGLNLTEDKAGNIYGTAVYGGNSGCPDGCGTVFRLAPDGTFTVLYSFAGGSDGYAPVGGVMFDKHGNIYGTTNFGGPYSQGTVFELTPSGSGWTETILHAFDGYDGANPTGRLLLKGGVLYGTTQTGGTYFAGSVFALNPKRKK